MPHCANLDCPDRARLAEVEFRDDIEACPRCGVPLADGPPPNAGKTQEEYVELADAATFMYVHEAELAASHLAAAGIDAHIVNRDTLGIHAFLSVAIGGARVQVAPEDLVRARQVLTAQELDLDVDMPGAGPYRGGATIDPDICKNCGNRKPTGTAARIPWFALLSVLLLGIPLLFRRRRCSTCGART